MEWHDCSAPAGRCRNGSGTGDVGLVAEAIEGRQLVPLAMHWYAGRLDSKTRFHRAGQVGR